MENIAELLQIIPVGIVTVHVANFLLNTNRVLKAIELCKECLTLLKSKALEMQSEFVRSIYIRIYLIMFVGYIFTIDHKSGIKCGEELLVLIHGYGMRALEGFIKQRVAGFHCVQGQYHKAKELNEKALEIMIETGNREGEALCYGKLGTVSQSLGSYLKAVNYFHKALAIKKEIGDRRGETACYRSLGPAFHSLGQYLKSEECLQKALAITKEFGDKQGEAKCYANLGFVVHSLGKYVKAEEYLEKAVSISKEIGDKEGEASAYAYLGAVVRSLCQYDKAEKYLQRALAMAKGIGDRQVEGRVFANLGNVFHSVGEYVKAVEYLQKATETYKEIGDRQAEGSCYGNLGAVFQSLGEHVKAEEYLRKSLVIAEEIGDKQGEESVHVNLGNVFHSQGEYYKTEECLQKAVSIAKEIGDKQGEATCYGSLGNMFQFQGEFVKAKEYHTKALLLSNEIGDVEAEFRRHVSLAWCTLASEGDIQGTFTSLLASISKCEKMRGFLRDNDQFKISFLDQHISPYRMLSDLFCMTGDPIKALYPVELGRARALADLMSAQYSSEEETSVDPRSWVGIETIIEKENNCTCLYISFFLHNIFLWLLKPNKAIHFQQIDVSDLSILKGSVRDLDGFFGKEPFRKLHFLPQEYCEDRSLFALNRSHWAPQSQEDSLAACRLVEEVEDEDQGTQPSLSLYYKLIIAPVADVLEETEIIIVPDRSLYKVPFAALKDENGKYLSETFRIRIVPSLTTLKLIQDRPIADNGSEANPLIVGDPDVSQVFFLPQLPFARKEAEMIGGLLGVQPLLGYEASKPAVLEMLHSASLIHFAAHGDAERGEIALAPLRPIRRILKREDYLLTMSNIAQVQLRAKLVVLSCCHSGRGQIRAEGVVGIARAFLGSGARSVLVALWAIQDKATEQFMSRFYEQLVRGESASESLHQAMKWMRENCFSDVRQWAPFMLIGDNVTFDFGK